MALPPGTTTRIDDLVAGTQARGRAPSVIVGVVRDGKLAHVATAGTTPEPTPDTQYRIGSLTKSLTAALLMRLRDEGRLRLDDPLTQHLPGTPIGTVTLRQLLGHVSGLRREPPGPWWERAPGTDLDVLLRGLEADMLVHPPYRRHHYSNLAYALLAGVACRITGEPWWELVDRELLKPLGMDRTTYQCQEPFARGYVVHPWHGTLREEPRHDSVAMAPAGQLWSTVTDMARWAAFVAGSTPGPVAPDTLQEMLVPTVISDPETWRAGYGLGFQLWRRGERVFVGHSGSMPGYVAMLVAHRASGTAAIGFVNAYNARFPMLPLCAEVVEAVLEGEPERAVAWRPAAPAPPGMAELCGRWWFMGQEYQASYNADAGELVIRLVEREGLAPWTFVADGADRWRCVSGSTHGETLQVRRDAAGHPVVLDIATYEFTREPLPDI